MCRRRPWWSLWRTTGRCVGLAGARALRFLRGACAPCADARVRHGGVQAGDQRGGGGSAGYPALWRVTAVCGLSCRECRTMRRRRIMRRPGYTRAGARRGRRTLMSSRAERVVGPVRCRVAEIQRRGCVRVAYVAREALVRGRAGLRCAATGNVGDNDASNGNVRGPGWACCTCPRLLTRLRRRRFRQLGATD